MAEHRPESLMEHLRAGFAPRDLVEQIELDLLMESLTDEATV
jgi:hypothetical protein